MMVTDVIDAYLTRQRSLGMRFESAGEMLHFVEAGWSRTTTP